MPFHGKKSANGHDWPGIQLIPLSNRLICNSIVKPSRFRLISFKYNLKKCYTRAKSRRQCHNSQFINCFWNGHLIDGHEHHVKVVGPDDAAVTFTQTMERLLKSQFQQPILLGKKLTVSELMLIWKQASFLSTHVKNAYPKLWPGDLSALRHGVPELRWNGERVIRRTCDSVTNK